MQSIWGPQTDLDLTGDQLRDEVQLHIARHLGEADIAFSDNDGWSGKSREPGPPVDVLVVPPEGERRFAYVVSFGGSLKRPADNGGDDKANAKRLEFVLAAPQGVDKKTDRSMLNLAANTVRQFAKLAHIQPVRITLGETVAFSKDPEPMFEESDQVAFAFIKPRLPGEGFSTMNVAGGEAVSFIAPAPIFRSELEAGHRRGDAWLARALECGGVTEMLAFSRLPVIQDPWYRRGLLGRMLAAIEARKAR
jgi:hypothetical protein